MTPNQRLSAVPYAESVRNLGWRRLTPDRDQLLPVTSGQIRVVAAVRAITPTREPIEPAASAPHVRAGSGFRDQDALDPKLIDGALHSLLGDAEHLRHGRNGRQPLTGLPV